jgi:hypothetical protein
MTARRSTTVAITWSHLACRAQKTGRSTLDSSFVVNGRPDTVLKLKHVVTNRLRFVSITTNFAGLMMTLHEPPLRKTMQHTIAAGITIRLPGVSHLVDAWIAAAERAAQQFQPCGEIAAASGWSGVCCELEGP